jgi:hypothetical protein
VAQRRCNGVSGQIRWLAQQPIDPGFAAQQVAGREAEELRYRLEVSDLRSFADHEAQAVRGRVAKRCCRPVTQPLIAEVLNSGRGDDKLGQL